MKLYHIMAMPVLLGLSGCISTSATRLNGTESMPPTVANSVDIYKSRLDIPGDYREVGLLDSDGDAIYTTYGQLYKSMRKKAAAMGANGILLGQQTEPDPEIKIAAMIFDGRASRQVSATAIIVENKPLILAPIKKQR